MSLILVTAFSAENLYAIAHLGEFDVFPNLFCNPKLLILDEAFSGVDFGSQEDITDVLKLLTSESKTILMSTHDLNSLSDRYDKVLCLSPHPDDVPTHVLPCPHPSSPHVSNFT